MAESNRKALTLGFTAGATLVVVAALYFYPRAPAPVSVPVTTSTATAVAHPATEPDRPANPHAFATERESASGTPLLSGTIDLDPSITLSPGSAVTVFVIARTGPGKGKPVLARRIDAKSFPLEFVLTGADSMMAGEKPAQVSLEARIDLDSDAMTREPGSPTARLTSVSLGSTHVALTLKPEA